MKDFYFYAKKNYDSNRYLFYNYRDHDGKKVNLYMASNRKKLKSRWHVLEHCGEKFKVNGGELDFTPNDICVEVNKKYNPLMVFVGGAAGYLFAFLIYKAAGIPLYQYAGIAIGSAVFGIVGLIKDWTNRALAEAWNEDFIPEKQKA